ncbi:MAG: phage portal protein, partial [Oscillospiraceae bacterium]|nr:phage portal protein [Oscillospiraceae bacterium]
MSVFDKIIKRGTPAKAAQTAANAFTANSFLTFPEKAVCPSLYKSLRDSVPMIDAALNKTVRLTGGFTVQANNSKYQKLLDEFQNKIPIGAGRCGLQLFMDTYFSELLTYGTAAGEIILNENGELHSLYAVPVHSINLKRSAEDFNRILVCQPDSVSGEPVKFQDLVFYTALNPDAGEIYGNSVLKGLSVMSEILMKIYSSIGKNFERMGNLRFAVTYNPGNDLVDRSFAKERAEQIAAEWSNAVNSSDVRDFVAVGDVNIRVIGADNQILDSEIPVRQILEQILSKLSLPPFMLGLSWSTTERMSSLQADVLTTELWSYRRVLTPVIEKICDMFLRTQGNSDGVTVNWNDITLQDSLDEARAKLYLAQAKALEET